MALIDALIETNGKREQPQAQLEYGIHSGADKGAGLAQVAEL